MSVGVALAGLVPVAASAGGAGGCGTGGGGVSGGGGSRLGEGFVVLPGGVVGDELETGEHVRHSHRRGPRSAGHCPFAHPVTRLFVLRRQRLPVDAAVVRGADRRDVVEGGEEGGVGRGGCLLVHCRSLSLGEEVDGGVRGARGPWAAWGRTPPGCGPAAGRCQHVGRGPRGGRTPPGCGPAAGRCQHVGRMPSADSTDPEVERRQGAARGEASCLLFIFRFRSFHHDAN